MPVEINQWRATIGCFLLAMKNISPMIKTVGLFSILFHILKLYWFCCRFIVISILVLPLTFILQFLAVHFVATQTCPLPLYARLHQFARIVIYTTVELSKRIPLAVNGLIRCKRFAVKKLLFGYAYFYIVCMTCYTLHTHWVFGAILLSGDVETNPGPETLSFCSWNLNSIIAHDFLRISLIEA